MIVYSCTCNTVNGISKLKNQNQDNALTAQKRPNFVLLMGDDHGWDEVGYNGHPHIKTPVLDEMATEGLRFDRFYSGHPSCSPTRGSFMTGRHPIRTGLKEVKVALVGEGLPHSRYTSRFS